jgi:hypothetical protein
MIKTAAIGWLVMTAALSVMFLTPPPYGFLLWLPVQLGLLFAIRAGNRHQEELRCQEAQNA